MSRVMEEMCDKAAAEAAHDSRVEIAINLIQIGKMSCQEIAASTGLTLEEVKELAQKKSA